MTRDEASTSSDRLQRRTYEDSAGNFRYWLVQPPAEPLGRLQFAHANGIPAGVYLPLLRRMAELGYEVAALDLFSGDAPAFYAADDLWNRLEGVLARHVDACRRGPVLAVGHSLGAIVSMGASLRRPDLFRSLILLDPAIVPIPESWLWNVAKRAGLSRYLPLARKTLRKRRRFPGRAELENHYRGKSMFSGWGEDYFQAFLEHAFCQEEGGGVGLTVPAEVEAAIYAQTPHCLHRGFSALTVPARLVLGGRSPYYTPRLEGQLGRINPLLTLEVLPEQGHFLPMTSPEVVLDLVRAGFTEDDRPGR